MHTALCHDMQSRMTCKCVGKHLEKEGDTYCLDCVYYLQNCLHSTLCPDSVSLIV